MRGVVYFIFVLFIGVCGDLFVLSIKIICEEYLYFCVDLNIDGWCWVECLEIICYCFNFKDDDSDWFKYVLLVNYENYEFCIVKVL